METSTGNDMDEVSEAYEYEDSSLICHFRPVNLFTNLTVSKCQMYL
jgi:hypothetical protein